MGNEYAGKSVDQMVMKTPPKGTSRVEKLMSTTAQEKKEAQSGANDLTQWVAGSGTPPKPLGQRGRI